MWFRMSDHEWHLQLSSTVGPSLRHCRTPSVIARPSYVSCPAPLRFIIAVPAEARTLRKSYEIKLGMNYSCLFYDFYFSHCNDECEDTHSLLAGDHYPASATILSLPHSICHRSVKLRVLPSSTLDSLLRYWQCRTLVLSRISVFPTRSWRSVGHLGLLILFLASQIKK